MNRKQRSRRIVVFSAILCLLTVVAHGQRLSNQGKKVVVVDAWKKEFIFKGIVENVDANANWITVSSENIPGWTNSIFKYGITGSNITKTYKVKDLEVLKTLKPGNRITARVSEDDFTLLYDVKVVPPEDTPVTFPK